ncbi:UDP-3-O-glucosamine N-acyltransferase [Crassisporium funariophilum]|nr:UDP-3-O-glucosamine N-acyltransferase [Crassisporium funariophilum]
MDLDNVKSELVTREFLAVVLAGFGNDLIPLTSDYGEEPCPKSLLPVANKPLLEYILVWLEQSGIKDVLLICPTSHRSSIYHHIHSDVSSSSLRIDLQTYDDDSHESQIGTCDLLRQFSTRISEDFVVVPCDLIPPASLPLSLLLNKFRVDALSEGSIATTCWFASHIPEKGAHVEEWGPIPSSTPIIWESSTGTLLHIETPDDLDTNVDEIELRMALLSKYPRTKLSSALEDSHVYVCRRSVLDLLHAKPHFASLRQEFFPWLCNLQYQRHKKAKYGKLVNSLTETTSQGLSLQHSTLLPITQVKEIDVKELSSSVPASPTTSDGEHKQHPSLKVGVIIHRSDAGPAMRVNTVHKFYEINKRLLSGVTYSLPTDPKDRSLIDQKAQISSDTMIGESTQISERTTIKRSVIGRHCIIGKMVKITGCVLLDHCVVEDGAKLDNCILGKGTQVGMKAELTRCVTQAGYEVSAAEIVKGEKLEISDWTAPDDDDDSEDAKDTNTD